MIAYDNVGVDATSIKLVEEHSLGPVEGPVIDPFSNIKNIPKMNDSPNAVLLKNRKESVGIKPLEVIMEHLRAFANSKVRVRDKDNLVMLCQTFANMLRLHYSRSLHWIQPPLPLRQQESAACLELDL